MISPSLIVGGLVVLCVFASVAHAQNWPANALTLPTPNWVSQSTPGMAVFHNKLYYTFQSDSNIYLTSTFSADTWSYFPKKLYSGQQNTKLGPKLVAFPRNQLILAFHSQTTENILIAVSKDGESWSDPITLPDSYDAALAPSFAVVHNSLYMIFNTASGAIKIASSSDGLSWPASPSLVFDSQTTDQAPALAEINGQLVLVFRSRSSQSLFTAVSQDGLTWSAAAPLNHQAGSAPVLSAFGNSVVLVWQGTDYKFNSASSPNGTSWPTEPTKIISYDSTALTPALVQFKGQLVLSFHSQTTDNLLFAFTTPDDMTF